MIQLATYYQEMISDLDRQIIALQFAVDDLLVAAATPTCFVCGKRLSVRTEGRNRKYCESCGVYLPEIIYNKEAHHAP